MKGFGLAVLVCASMALTTGTASALGPVTLGIGGGVNVPVGDTGEGFDNGFNVRGIVGFAPPVLPFGVRGVLGYEKMDFASAIPGVTGSADILSGVAGIKLGLGAGPVKPYITAGLGAFSVNANVEGDPSSGSTVKFGIDGGAGLDLKLGMVNAFVEARIQNAFTDEGWNPALTGASSLQMVPVTFGVTF